MKSRFFILIVAAGILSGCDAISGLTASLASATESSAQKDHEQYLQQAKQINAQLGLDPVAFAAKNAAAFAPGGNSSTQTIRNNISDQINHTSSCWNNGPCPSTNPY